MKAYANIYKQALKLETDKEFEEMVPIKIEGPVVFSKDATVTNWEGSIEQVRIALCEQTIYETDIEDRVKRRFSLL